MKKVSGWRLAGLRTVALWLGFAVSVHAQVEPGKVPVFDVVSIRPSAPDTPMSVQWGGGDGYRARNQPLFGTMALAYLPAYWLFNSGWGLKRITGAPAWMQKDPYDIDAKVSLEDVQAWKNQGMERELLHAMLQAALKDRCKLVAHREMVEGPAYALVLKKRVAALKDAEPGKPPPPNAIQMIGGGRMIPYQRGDAVHTQRFTAVTMEEFAAYLSGSSDRIVLDRTGIKGTYDFPLSERDTSAESASDPEGSSRFDLEEMGFKLVPVNAPLETIVIDHVEKPTSN